MFRLVHIDPTTGRQKTTQSAFGGQGSTSNQKVSEFGADGVFYATELAAIDQDTSNDKFSFLQKDGLLFGKSVAGVVATKKISDFAMVNFDGTTGTTTANVIGTYSRSGTTITVTLTGHGHIVGHVVYCSFTTGGATSGSYTVVTVADSDHFTITVPAAGTSGNVTLLRKPINASTGVLSVTYLNAAGQFVVNFLVAFQDAFYFSPIGSCNCAGVSGIAYMGAITHTAQACNVITASAAAFGTPITATAVQCVFFR